MTPQAVLGMMVLGVIVLASLATGYNKSGGADSIQRIGRFLFYFATTFVGSYAGLALLGGIFWLIAWVGILLREVLQWLIEGALYPFHWLF